MFKCFYEHSLVPAFKGKLLRPDPNGTGTWSRLLWLNPFPTVIFIILQFTNWNYAQAIFISWSIALPEYSLQVPANRIAHQEFGGPFSAPQLKVISEFCSLTTFAVFSAVVLKEKPRWVDLGAFVLIIAGVLLSLLTKPAAKPAPPPAIPPPPPPDLAQPQGSPQVELGNMPGRKLSGTVVVSVSAHDVDVATGATTQEPAQNLRRRTSTGDKVEV